MIEVSRKRLEFATEAFLMEMRRQAFVVRPENPPTVQLLQAYPPVERSALMGAILRAIKATDPAGDAIFQTWLDKQISAEPQNQ